jgi:hypothetical protein
MNVIKPVVDNRVVLLGLDKLYRDAMKRHERGELLICARAVAAALRIPAKNVVVEGYYGEDPDLTEYFRLQRGLQDVESSRTPEVSGLPEYRRLLEVASAPIYGRPRKSNKLLPVGRDSLSQALLDTRPSWTVDSLTALAAALAVDTDDISLVGLAARIEEPVVLAALRESVVLYAELIALGIPPTREYAWEVDQDLAKQATRFVDVFNALFDEALPQPSPPNADSYWHAHKDNQVLGRCVRLGYDDTQQPIRHYHWGICLLLPEGLAVQEFWHPDVWTTERYRAALGEHASPPEL